MRKLKLEIDTLQVESFEMAEARGSTRGTVRGAGVANDDAPPVTTNDPSFIQTCWFYTCGGCTTADPAYCPPTQQQDELGPA